MESDKKPSGFAGRGCEGGPALVFCHEGCVNPRLIFLTPQPHASPTPGGEEGGMSAKGLKAIVRAMRDDKRERMPRLLPQAMAEELPPEGDDARLQGKARRRQHQGDSRGVRARRSVASTNRQGACVRARRDGRGGAPEFRVLGTEGAARPRDARPTRHLRRSLPGSVTCPPGDSTATSRDCTRLVATTTRSPSNSHALHID